MEFRVAQTSFVIEKIIVTYVLNLNSMKTLLVKNDSEIRGEYEKIESMY